MIITFEPLKESHFSLLLKWLEAPHVKAWWDQDVKWTATLIQEKYADYVNGYKLDNGVAKVISAHIIYADNTPIGYIQIYNAYDFAREEPLIDLPARLAAFDVLIGEEAYLKQGIGSQSIAQFLKEHGTSYTHVFADPENSNIAAIRAYEKAGFKKSTKQPGTGEIWMICEQTTRPDPLYTIQKLIQEHYSNAKAIFWAGSVSQNQGTSASDLDLVIVFDVIPTAYREAFIYDGWPIDAFIHDLDTLRYFFEESRTGNGISGLIEMIIHGKEVLKTNPFSQEVCQVAESYRKQGPNSWSQAQIDKERFLITDILDDIKSPKNKEEQITSAVHLFEPLIQFYFRTQKKWAASGKSLMRLFKAENPDLSEEFTKAFESLVQTGDVTAIEAVATKMLEPHGGFLWDGFRSDAPTEWRLSVEDHRYASVKADELEKIYALESALLEPQVRKNITKLDRLIAGNFYEIGASGKMYDKKNILSRLPLEQNDDLLGKVIDFEIYQISENLIRANYTLEEKTRCTLRTSIWKRQHNNYQMIFHQGTKCEVGDEHEE